MLQGPSFVAALARLGTVSIPIHGTYVLFGVVGTSLVVPGLLRDESPKDPVLGRWTWVRPSSPGWYSTVRFDRELSPDEFFVEENPMWLSEFTAAVARARGPTPGAAAP